MKESTAMSFLLFAIFFGQVAATADLPAPIEPDRVVLVDEEVWPAFNWASYDQDKVVSHGNYQYSPFWDADMVLVVARRNLETQAVQALRFPQHTLTIRPADAHRNTVVGISAADGRLHLSWDHHNNDLRYTKSVAGFVTDPPETLSVDHFEPAQPLMDDAPQSVTYPRFVTDAEDNLFFIYRSGGSGKGENVFTRYDAAAGTWEMVSQRLFSQEGTYAPWNDSQSRNAYLHDVLFGPSGKLHVTWVYREESRTWASNHDLHYAYSEDHGVTWKNNAGEPIADLSKGDPIALDDPGIVVREIPVYSWLMNQCGMTVDSQGRPHVATYKMAEPLVPEKLTHNPPSDARIRLGIYHYYRDTDGQWHSHGPLDIPGRGESSIDRPNIVAGPDDMIFIYWPARQGFRCHVASPEDGYATWKTFLMTGPGLTTHDAAKHDRRLLRERGILSFTANPKATEVGHGYAFVDFDLERLKAAAR
jgi:hypothetical protein